MNKICTSIEQSQKLLELGIDVNTADMFWLITGKPRLHVLVEDEKYSRWDCMPAWSLSALLELIPAGNILLRDAFSKNYKCINTVDSDYYDNPLDAAFEMVCWLKENEEI